MGVVAATVDLLVGPVQIAAALIVIFTFLLSLAYPVRRWQWALLVGICVPVGHLLARFGGYTNPARPDNFYITYLSMVPAFIGAYSAALVGKFAARSNDGKP
jgi:ABC-type xylose transport system permease subunit